MILITRTILSLAHERQIDYFRNKVMHLNTDFVEEKIIEVMQKYEREREREREKKKEEKAIIIAYFLNIT